MRDLGAAVLTWDDRLSRGRDALGDGTDGALHRAVPRATRRRGWRRSTWCSSIFSPHRIRALAASGNELMRAGAARLGDLRSSLVPPDVAGPVLALLDDISPLATALEQGPLTLAHGDLATVNMAFEGDDLVLIDWAMPTAAPGSLDIARFMAGCSSVVEPSREDLLAAYERAAGPAYDERSMRLSLLSGLVWLGLEQGPRRRREPRPRHPRTREGGPRLVGP